MKRGLLLSGGMDSIALSWLVRPEIAYTVDYGQAAAQGELRAAIQAAHELAIEHRLIVADCSALGSGDMAGRAYSPHAPIPEWWPFRNQLLATLVGMHAINDGVDELLFASVSSDSKHVDGRDEFFTALSALMCMQEGQLKVSAPALALTTSELVRKSGVPHHVLAWSHSCHVSEYACGQCRGCFKHAAVMSELGYGDY
jgi:7-cyano-7-deazaguanine synthase